MPCTARQILFPLDHQGSPLQSCFICSVEGNSLQLANTVENCHPMVLKDLVAHSVPRCKAGSSGKKQSLPLGTDRPRCQNCSPPSLFPQPFCIEKAHLVGSNRCCGALLRCNLLVTPTLLAPGLYFTPRIILLYVAQPHLLRRLLPS